MLEYKVKTVKYLYKKRHVEKSEEFNTSEYVTVGKEQEINGISVVPVIQDLTQKRGSQYTATDFYIRNNIGIAIIGCQDKMENETHDPEFWYENPFYIIKYPILKNMTWQNPKSEQIRRIESIDDEVTIGDNVYKNCLRISIKYKKGKSKTTEWYAPGIGLIKYTSESEPKDIYNGTSTASIEKVVLE